MSHLEYEDEEQQPIHYKDIMKLGFKSTVENDKVFFDEFGVEYTITNLKLSKVYEFDWDQITRTVTLWKTKTDGTTILTFEVIDLEQLEFLILLLKKVK